MYKDIREELKQIARKNSFTFEWKITFVRVVKK